MKLLERVCPFCSATEFDVLLDLLVSDFAPLNPTYSLVEIAAMGFADAQRFKIVKCHHCGFVYSRHVLNDELTHHLYSRVISVEKALAYRRQKIKKWQRLPVLHLLFSLVDKKSDADVSFLDFGCGWGEILQVARACGAQSFGVEIEPQRIKFLREQGFVVEETLEKLTDRAPFDLVYSKDVLEHVPNPDQLINSIASVTRPGGYAFFAVPHYSDHTVEQISTDFRNGKGLPDKNVNPWEHLNYFSASTFRSMLEKHGFTVIAPISALAKPVFVRRFVDCYPFIRNILGAFNRGVLGCRTHGTSLIVQRF